MKNIFRILCSLILVYSFVYAGYGIDRIDRNQKMLDAGDPVLLKSPYNYSPISQVFIFPLAQGFISDSIVVGTEVASPLSGFYDYKSNGEANIYIQVDPSNPGSIQIIDTQADSTDPPGQTTRRTNFAFSTDAGVTWQYIVDVPDGIRSGFGVLHLRNGAALIANHAIMPITGNRLDAVLHADAAPLAGTFTTYAHSNPASTPFGIWPQIAVYSNGNVGMVSRRNVTTTAPPETLYYSVWNGSTFNARTPIYITGMNFSGTVGSNMRFHIATNGSGRVTIIAAPVLQIDTLENSKMFARTSTDNGVTWGNLETVFAPYTINSGQDTIATAGGSGFVYKPNTDKWFLAFPVTADNLYAQGRLFLRKSNGDTVTICSVPQVGGAETYAQNMAFVFTIDFPALGWSADGSTLYCVYSVVMPDTSRGFNQRDIFMQYSLNEGTTWSNPTRITNTVNIDETYPSISYWNRGAGNGPYEANIIYMKDPGVGPTSFNGNSSTAPPSRNTLIFRKITGLPPIGIQGNNGIVKEYNLVQNYPNPFNPVTTIEYDLLYSGFVSLKIYDLLGREVAVLVNAYQQAGSKQVVFNSENISSGIYFYTIKADNFTATKKMMVLK